MKKIGPIVLIIVSFCVFAVAQDPSPTPSPTAADDRDVVKITTALIQLDVTVTDKKGNPVTDLRRDEIEIFENGKRQDISNLSFVNSNREQIVKEGKAGKPPVTAVPVLPTGSNPRPENVRRAIALVVDDLSLSFDSMDKVRRNLRAFVTGQMQDGDLVAVLRTGAGIGYLSQFTTNKQQLLAAIDALKFNIAVRPGIFEPMTLTLKEELNGVKGSDGTVKDYSDEIKLEKERDREISSNRENIFQTGTLGAINFIIRGMKELPGRKSIMLLSDGFKMFERDERGLPKETMSNTGMRRLVEFANRSSVVIYTLDPRGLVIPTASAEDRVTSLWDEGRANELRDSQDGLKYLARETGGLAFINQNSLQRGISKVLDDQSYYLVAYEPDDATFDPKTRRFNKVAVKVSRPDVDVRYRSGFFGVSDEIEKRDASEAKRSVAQALMSPFGEQEITLRFNPIFIAGEKDSHYVRSYLHLNAGDLSFVSNPDGTYTSVFEIAAVSLGENGAPSDLSAKQFTLSIKGDAYARMMKKGIVYEYVYQLKKPGAMQYRIAVKDVATGKVGSANQFINVPNLKKGKLALSGIVFADTPGGANAVADPVTDTALRQFKHGSVVRFGASIYNPKVDGGAKPNLYSTVKIYKDGALIYTSASKAVDADKYDPVTGLTTTGLIRIGDTMEAGEYFVQVTVSDNSNRGNSAVASQFASFEVVGNDK